MNDTSKDMRDRWRSLVLSRSGAERVRMGFEMFDAARALIRASLDGVEDEDQERWLILKRTYGRELDESTLTKIAEHWRSPRRRGSGR